MKMNYKNLLLFQLFTIIYLLYVLFVYMYIVAIILDYVLSCQIISIKYIMAIMTYTTLIFHILYTAVVPDDDHGRISEEEDPQPIRSITPPTPPVHHQPSPSPPRPIRQRSMAQLRPVSIPNIVSDIAGPDPVRRIADFDRHYMPDGQPAAEASVCGNTDEHRSQLKENAEGLSRSLSEVFAYLTHGTSSLEEARKLLGIITNVSRIMFLICFTYIHHDIDMHPDGLQAGRR
jgi:hypothetical protein